MSSYPTVPNGFTQEINSMMMNDGILVGVYGTLKKGYHRHPAMRSSKSMGDAWVPGLMLHLGGYPMIINQPAEFELKRNSRIKVEVYKVDEEVLADLDGIEGHPNFYDRRLVKTAELGDVWVYYGKTQRYWIGDQKVIYDGTWSGPATYAWSVNFYDGSKKPKVTRGPVTCIDKATGQVHFLQNPGGKVLVPEVSNPLSDAEDEVAERIVYLSPEPEVVCGVEQIKIVTDHRVLDSPFPIITSI